MTISSVPAIQIIQKTEKMFGYGIRAQIKQISTWNVVGNLMKTNLTVDLKSLKLEKKVLKIRLEKYNGIEKKNFIERKI